MLPFEESWPCGLVISHILATSVTTAPSTLKAPDHAAIHHAIVVLLGILTSQAGLSTGQRDKQDTDA